MTALLVFLGLGLGVWLADELLGAPARRDARRRNPTPRHTRNHGRSIR